MFLRHINYVIVCSLLLISNQGLAFDCESQITGDWEDTNTWINCNGTVPQNDDSVTIKNGNTVILSSLTNNLESLFVEGGGDLSIITGTSFFVSINANNSITSSIDLSNATMDLTNNLIINANNKNILLGTVNGDFELTLNSSAETHLTNTIGGEIPLASLITDADGTTYLADSLGEINTKTIYVNNLIEFNDNVVLLEYTNIKSQGGIITFNKSLDSGMTQQGFAITQSVNSIINLNDKVGAVSELSTFNVFNSDDALININTSEINTRGNQRWDLDVILNSPTQEVLMSSSNGAYIRFGKSSSTFSIRSANANVDSLIIETTGNIDVMSNVGDNNQALKNLTINSSSTNFTKNQIIVDDTLTITGSIILENNFLLNGSNIDIQGAIENGGFNLTIETIGTQGESNISGVLSGAGDFIKNGDGEVDFASINTTTGNILINEGVIYTNNVSENVIPSVPVISVAAMGEFGLYSDDSDVFHMQPSQTIIGTGNLGGLFDSTVVPSGAVIGPGFSPGQLIGHIIEMETGSQLNIELNGLMAGDGYDQLIVETIDLNADNINGAILNLTIDNGFSPDIGDTFKIIDVIDPNMVSGTFNNLPEGTEISLGLIKLIISYVSGDGNDVVLTVTKSVQMFVDKNAMSGGDGSSWGSAFNNLQDALAAAVSGNDIWVTQGVYYPDVGDSQVDNDRLASFTLIDGVSVYGGFNGAEIQLNQRDPELNVTILSGDINQDDGNSDGNHILEDHLDVIGLNSYHIITGSDVDLSTVFSGFIVTAGQANVASSTDERYGGGMYCGLDTSGPSINQSTFIGNYAIVHGAATAGCSQDVKDSDFINNYSGEIEISSSNGGAVSARGGNYENVLFLGNTSTKNAGAIYSIGDPLTIINSRFVSNQALENRAGAIFSVGNLNLDNVLFSGNSSKFQAGAIYLRAGSTEATFTNVTMTGNHTTDDLGGAVRTFNIQSLDIRNSIIWNNHDRTTDTTATSSIYFNGGTYTQSNSLVQNFGISEPGNLDEDPLFVTDTDPFSAPTTLGDAHLMDISITINSGDNSFVTTATDLDGKYRIFNSNVDMGAYENYPIQVFKDGFE